MANRKQSQPASTRREIKAIFAAGDVPDADQLYELLKTDHIANYVWWRALDWVLWRQARGLPVYRLGDKDEVSAGVDARFMQAHATYHDLNLWPPRESWDIAEISHCTVIRRWLRDNRPLEHGE